MLPKYYLKKYKFAASGRCDKTWRVLRKNAEAGATRRGGGL